MNYINTLADILIVQSVARRWLTLKKVKMLIRELNQSTNYKQHRYGYNKTSASWQHGKVNIVTRRMNPVAKAVKHQDEFDLFNQESVDKDGWYDGNKSETSDMLRNWKGRSSKNLCDDYTYKQV